MVVSGMRAILDTVPVVAVESEGGAVLTSKLAEPEMAAGGDVLAAKLAELETTAKLESDAAVRDIVDEASAYQRRGIERSEAAVPAAQDRSRPYHSSDSEKSEVSGRECSF